jgi:hypothetical protein
MKSMKMHVPKPKVRTRAEERQDAITEMRVYYPHVFSIYDWKVWRDMEKTASGIEAMVAEMLAWCEDRFPPGRMGMHTSCLGIVGFKHSDDAFEFKMRWA